MDWKNFGKYRDLEGHKGSLPVYYPAFLHMSSTAHSFVYRQDGFELSLNLDAKILKYGMVWLWFHSKCAFLHLIFIRNTICCERKSRFIILYTALLENPHPGPV